MRNEQRTGVALGVAAYCMWGAFPLFFRLLEPSSAFEIVANRMVWSAVVMAVVVVASRKLPHVRAILRSRRTTLLLVIAAATITSNWGAYVYGVNSGRVVETSLGYFINPLVTVLMGVLILRERLRMLQWLAIGIGTVAVVVITVDYGHLPVIALVLALSFGTYGLAKKQADVGAIESLSLETAILAPFALIGLLVVGDDGHFLDQGADHTALLVSTGVVTAIPLLCFGAAATRVPMVTLGVLQYLAPILQFIVGITVVGEHMPTVRWIGFALVWLALVVFTYDALRVRRQVLADAAAQVSTEITPSSA